MFHKDLTMHKYLKIINIYLLEKLKLIKLIYKLLGNFGGIEEEIELI